MEDIAAITRITPAEQVEFIFQIKELVDLSRKASEHLLDCQDY